MKLICRERQCVLRAQRQMVENCWSRWCRCTRADRKGRLCGLAAIKEYHWLENSQTNTDKEVSSLDVCPPLLCLYSPSSPASLSIPISSIPGVNLAALLKLTSKVQSQLQLGLFKLKPTMCEEIKACKQKSHDSVVAPLQGQMFSRL